jgi:hypothetical protein
MKQQLQDLAVRWTTTLAKMKQLRTDTCFDIALPATKEEVKQMEEQLGYPLPNAYKECLLSYSKQVEVGWYLCDGVELPKQFDEIFSGALGWGEWLEDLTELSEMVEEEELKGMLAFYSVPNGDLICFDMKKPEHPIYYWGHEGEGLTYLAPDFITFLSRLTDLYLVGPEMWQFESFIDSTGLNPKLSSAQKWIQFVENGVG